MAHTLIGLDIGSKRTGLAIAAGDVRIASPHATVATAELAEALKSLIREFGDGGVVELVIGLPRNLDGDSTAQTRFAEEIARQLAIELGDAVPQHFVDEALTSVKAEEELARRGGSFSKGDIDMLSAVYILEDYLIAQERADVR